MYKHILEKIDHVAVWPIISLIIFFGFFVGLIWWVFKLNKTYISYMESLPHENDHSSTLNSLGHENK